MTMTLSECAVNAYVYFGITIPMMDNLGKEFAQSRTLLRIIPLATRNKLDEEEMLSKKDNNTETDYLNITFSHNGNYVMKGAEVDVESQSPTNRTQKVFRYGLCYCKVAVLEIRTYAYIC
jgi:hypothetical protein